MTPRRHVPRPARDPAAVTTCSLSLAILMALSVAASATERRTVSVVNRTPGVVRGIYLAPAIAENWGVDRLTGSNIMPNDQRYVAAPEPGCGYDARIILDNRTEERQFGLDFCKSPMITVTGHSDPSDQQPDRFCSSGDCPVVAHAIGRFMIWHQAIRCVRAPCPHGPYTITENGEFRARAHKLNLDHMPARQRALFSFENIEAEGVGFKGKYRLDGASDTLFLQPTDVEVGQWKR